MLYLLLAEGFEETEAVAPLDVLRRAELPVQTVGVTGRVVTGAHGVPFTADTELDSLRQEDVTGVILPGGMPGTLNLQKDPRVTALLQFCHSQENLLAAICAAPMIPGGLGMLAGRRATCFPGFEDQLEDAILVPDSVVRDGHIITARGAGAALAFGAAITDYFLPQEGRSKGALILAQMQTPGYDR